MAQVLIDALTLRGMDVNLESGKTELIFDFRGQGAHEAKTRFFRHGDPVLEVQTKYQGTLYIKIVTHYKHLGTIYTTGGKLAAEVKQRLGQARQEFRRHRKTIYSNPNLDTATRISLFQTMVMSGLLFDIAIWNELTPAETKTFEGGIHGLYTSLGLALWGDQVYQWRQERLRARLSLPHPEILGRVARLRHLHHLCMKADDYIWSFLHLDGLWLQRVRADIDWLRLQIPRRLPQTDPHDDWGPWMEDMRYGKRWKNNVNVAQKHSVLQTTKRSDWHTWHRQFLELLRSNGLWQSKGLQEVTGGFPCMRCQKCFSSAQAWSVHAFVTHGRCTPSRKYASGTQCAVCLKEYAFHSRLVNHLRHATKCHQELQRRGLTTELEPSIGSVKESKLQRVRSSLPVLQVFGPLEAPVTDQAAVADWTTAEEEFFVSIIDVLELVNTTRCDVQGFVNGIWQACQRTILKTTELKQLINKVATEYAEGLDRTDVEDEWMYQSIQEMLGVLEETWSWRWLHGHLHRQQEIETTGEGKLKAIEEVKKLAEQPPAKPRVDRPFASKQLVFLHLFSGPRRHGDIQAGVEQFASAHQLHVRALSVDVVISLRYGDLLRHETQHAFMEAVKQGWVCGLAAGPPCETWSRAREHQLEQGWGPRPVRAIDSPEGLSQLSLKEARQVLFGNQLLSIATLLLTLCWLYGVCGILEHPAEPPRASSVSIWKLPILTYLARQRQVAKLTIMQGFYGAQSVKPTTFLITHPPPGAEKIMEAHRTQEFLPTKASIGRLDDGSYATSALKTYPPGLCAALAAVWGAALLKRSLPEHDEAVPVFLAEYFDTLHCCKVTDASHGPDFCTEGQYRPA